ncbi:MAG TPA: GAF domain-containing protein [Polyangiales bacterium]
MTILDSGSRRKFLLTPISPSLPPQSDPPVVKPAAPTAQPAQAQLPEQAPQAAADPAAARAPAKVHKQPKFQTVAYTPGMALPGANAAPAVEPAPRAPAPAPAAEPEPDLAAAPPPQPGTFAPPEPAAEAPAKKKKKFETVAFSADAAREALTPVKVGGHARQPTTAPATSTPAQPAARPGHAPQPTAAEPGRTTPTPPHLDLLLTRDEQPTPQNPLTYRERAYLIPRGMTVTEAEAALRFVLADLQRKIEQAPRGKFVNLAAFDHRWTEAPERPPLIVLEWRDWRGEPAVEYPAAERSSTAPGSGEDGERLAHVFQELHELAHLHTAVEGLDFVIKLLADTVPSAAASACLYDINTDELRFVALSGPGADALRGTAVTRSAGVLGQACKLEGQPLVVDDVLVHAGYSAAIDGRPGLDVANMLLHAVVREGRLLGLLQLINRQGGFFSADDVHVLNYVADALAEFLQGVRVRPT